MKHWTGRRRDRSEREMDGWRRSPEREIKGSEIYGTKRAKEKRETTGKSEKD